MSWQKQHKKSYYYRSKRINGRVVTEYVGSGQNIAQSIQAEAAQRAAERAALQRYEQIKQQLDECEELVRILTYATLLINGYHQHKNQWRKKRVKRNPSESTG